MKIRYLGHSCFELTSESGITVVTDPYTGVGYSLPANLIADVVTVSHGHFDHSFVDGVRAKAVVDTLVEYSREGLEIHGVPCYHDEKKGALRGKNIAYTIKMDGTTFCHLGDLGEAYSDELVQRLGKADVLFIPVGGRYTVDGVTAKKFVDGIAPRVVIPMHYKPVDGSLDITDAQPFLQACADKKITRITDGVLSLDENSRGIFYMERVK